MNRFIGILAAGVISISLIMAFNVKTEIAPTSSDIEIPEEVNAVLQDYCFGCHNTESRNEKGRDKLSIDKLGELPKAKLAAKLNKIAKELDEGNMPPKKFLAKYPEKDPSKKDKKKVIKWAKEAAAKL